MCRTSCIEKRWTLRISVLETWYDTHHKNLEDVPSEEEWHPGRLLPETTQSNRPRLRHMIETRIFEL